MKIKENLGYVVAAFAFVACLGVGGVLAANSVDVGNSDTGERSENEARLDLENDVNVENENETDIHNMFHVMANTGDNEVMGNDGDVDMTTGDIDLAFKVANMVGFEDADDWGSNLFGNIKVGNSDTGERSENKATAEVENNVSLENENKTDIDNEMFVCLNTGRNVVGSGNLVSGMEGEHDGHHEGEHGGNDGNVNVTTGDISAKVSAKNEVGYGNGWSGLSNPFGNVTVGNNGTGDRSENDAKAEIENNVRIENRNVTDINNNLSLNANTGNNVVRGNDGDVTLKTGSINVNLDFANQVNY